MLWFYSLIVFRYFYPRHFFWFFNLTPLFRFWMHNESNWRFLHQLSHTISYFLKIIKHELSMIFDLTNVCNELITISHSLGSMMKWLSMNSSNYLLQFINHYLHVFILRFYEFRHCILGFSHLIRGVFKDIMLLSQIFLDLLVPNALVLPNHIDIHLHF